MTKIRKIGTSQTSDNSITHGVKKSIADFKLNYKKQLLNKDEERFYFACAKADWTLDWQALGNVKKCNDNVLFREEVRKQVG